MSIHQGTPKRSRLADPLAGPSRNAPAIIAKYWKKQSADVQHERYPKGSKEAKAAREAAATPRSARKSNSKKRAAENSDEDEFQAEEEDEEKVESEEEEAEDSDAPKSRRKSSGSAKANGSVKKERKASPAKKKAKKETSAKKEKKAKKPSPSPEVEEEQMDQDQDEAIVHEAQPAVSNHNHPMSDNHLKHMEEADWQASRRPSSVARRTLANSITSSRRLQLRSLPSSRTTRACC